MVLLIPVFHGVLKSAAWLSNVEAALNLQLLLYNNVAAVHKNPSLSF